MPRRKKMELYEVVESYYDKFDCMESSVRIDIFKNKKSAEKLLRKLEKQKKDDDCLFFRMQSITVNEE